MHWHAKFTTYKNFPSFTWRIKTDQRVMEEWPMSKFMLKNANGKPGHKIKANELEDQQN